MLIYQCNFYSYLGADFNSELKIWSCSDWKCVQTINFKKDLVDPVATTRLSMFKTAIDLSSNYLLLSDIARKCFYTLHLHVNQDKIVAYCTAISEFILACPAISFAIIDSQRFKTKKYNQLNNVNTQNSHQSSTNNLSTEFDTNINENSLNELLNTSSQSSSLSSSHTLQPQQLDTENNDLVTMIKVYCIQTKQLQEMQIFLSGEQSISAYNNNSVSPPPPVTTTGSNHSLHNSSSGIVSLFFFVC